MVNKKKKQQQYSKQMKRFAIFMFNYVPHGTVSRHNKKKFEISLYKKNQHG